MSRATITVTEVEKIGNFVKLMQLFPLALLNMERVDNNPNKPLVSQQTPCTFIITPSIKHKASKNHSKCRIFEQKRTLCYGEREKVGMINMIYGCFYYIAGPSSFLVMILPRSSS